MSPLEKCQIRSFAHFLTGLFFGSEFCKYIINFGCYHLIRHISEYVLPSVGCLFILLMISFIVQKLFSLMKYHLFIFFSFVSIAWGDISYKILLQAMFKILLTIFSSMIFIVSGLTFKSWINFEFILVCGVRRWSSFIPWHISVQFPHHHLFNKLSLAYCMCLLPLSINLTIKVWVYF